MSRASFFGADILPPETADLGGLLAARGRMIPGEGGAVLSVAVDARWRADGVARLLAATGFASEIAEGGNSGFEVTTPPSPDLASLAREWWSEGVKSVPYQWVPSPTAQRAWFLAAGRREVDGAQYVLGLDPAAPHTHTRLVEALMRAGIAPTLIVTHSGEPALRIAGHRRLVRLVEHVGAPPDDPEAREIWPRVQMGHHHL